MDDRFSTYDKWNKSTLNHKLECVELDFTYLFQKQFQIYKPFIRTHLFYKVTQ